MQIINYFTFHLKRIAFRLLNMSERIADHIFINCITSKKSMVSTTDSAVIIPCDPYTIIGSRGDEAMILACIQYFREKNKKEPIYIFGNNDYAGSYLNEAHLDSNIVYLDGWRGGYQVRYLCRCIQKISPSYIFILGADCMDGHYNKLLSSTLLQTYQSLTKLGYNTKLLGFSFNSHPDENILKKIKTNKLKIQKPYNLRDIFSYNRFVKFTGVHARLVSDSAFLLKPSTDDKIPREYTEWLKQKREDSGIIIGLNFHPMLKSYTSTKEIISDSKKIGHCITEVLKKNKNIFFILLAHDDRQGITDKIVLNEISQIIRTQGYRDRIIFLKDEVLHANTIKALCKHIDGVITSRMHLAIAALGCGIPVLTADYQDKFKGLLAHFTLPEKNVLSAEIIYSNELTEKIQEFIANLSNYKKIIEERLPEVLRLSHTNLN